MKEMKYLRRVLAVLGRCTHPAPLGALSQHDHQGTFLLKNHLPEFIASLWQRTLSGNILVCVFVSLKVKKTLPFTLKERRSSKHKKGFRENVKHGLQDEKIKRIKLRGKSTVWNCITLLESFLFLANTFYIYFSCKEEKCCTLVSMLSCQPSSRFRKLAPSSRVPSDCFHRRY